MYIRTKDGVYEVSEKTKYAQYSIRGMTMVKNADFQYISNENILNQSENLEELCDEFVMTHYFPETDYTKREVLKEDKDLMIKAVRLKKQHNKDRDLKNEFNIYGAVWCEFGLKYVAKMDENGELVLL